MKLLQTKKIADKKHNGPSQSLKYHPSGKASLPFNGQEKETELDTALSIFGHIQYKGSP